MSSSTPELDALITRETQRCANDRVAGKGARFTDCATTVQRILNQRENREILRRALGPHGLRAWDNEPHLRFHLLRGVTTASPLTFRIPVEAGDAFMRLTDDSPLLAYVRSDHSTNSLHSSVHVGQRKLLIGEVWFLTTYGHLSKIVVYIGAAGGQHIPALCELFPNHRFLLYDPAPFSKPLLDYMRRNPGRLAVYNELFPPPAGSRSDSELQAAVGGGEGFLLISDIRRRDQDSDAPTNKDVDEDMELQAAMCVKLQPKAAHLKCRGPYLAVGSTEDVEFTMPEGQIYKQPWAPHQSTECRLVCQPPYTELMTMSGRWYESAMFYHNHNTRYARFDVQSLAPLDVFLDGVYDTCFDCTFERYTIWLYLKTSTGGGGVYSSFAAVYDLFKRVIGREDERLLR